MRCLINHVQEEDRFLHRAADKSLTVLIHTVHANRKLLPIVLPHIISHNGSYNFDRITKTKTVERLLALVEDDSAAKVLNILREQVVAVES